MLVAGRCISGTREPQASYRIMPAAMATGQAAGVCAALAAKMGRSPRSIAHQAVQRELLKQKADLRDLGPLLTH
ncbi:MAG: FAD-dependent oxidoreductase [Planctomycetaceae bacterium]|nr:FAD-dependent oxidoreductase [Planctomycetaceae bacterium]